MAGGGDPCHSMQIQPDIAARDDRLGTLRLFQELGVEQNVSTTDGMRKFLIDEIAKWNALIDKAKVPRL